MNIDIGKVVVIVAALFFYVRLIILQRQRIKQAAQQAVSTSKKSGKLALKAPETRFAIVSPNKGDWVIAAIGMLIVILGILVYRQVIPVPVGQTYWWIPTALGILAFSWGFR